MGLTEREQGLVDTLDLSADEAAEKLGMTRAAVYTARSVLKRQGKVHQGGRPAREEGGGRKPDMADLEQRKPEPDDELIAPLRAALEAHDAKRARLVAAIEALGGKV